MKPIITTLALNLLSTAALGLAMVFVVQASFSSFAAGIYAAILYGWPVLITSSVLHALFFLTLTPRSDRL